MNSSMTAKAAIILLCTAAAVVYGIVHDQITARLCVEYFTIAHPPLFHTSSPAMLGLCWGVAATFPLGASVGAILAIVSQSDGISPTPVRIVLTLICRLLAIMAISAAFAGLAGFELSRRAIIELPTGFAEIISADRYDRFMAVWFAHGASYVVGLAGSSVIILRLWAERARPHFISVFPHSKWAFVRTVLIAILAGLAVWLRFFHE